MARTKLTALAVEKIRPDPQKRIELSDTLLPALRLIVQPSGRKSWAVRTRIHGRSAKITLGDCQVLDLAKARKAAGQLLAQVQAGEDPRHERVSQRLANAQTLGKVVDDYLHHRASERLRPRTLVEVKRALVKMWAPLHTVPVTKLSTAMVANQLLHLKTGHGPIAANHARTYLSGCLTWARKQGMIEGNPVTLTEAPGVKRTRERVLSPEELRAIWNATRASTDYDLIIRLLMLLAARRQEVAGMLWCELDMEHGLWVLSRDRTKAAVQRELPLPSQALTLLADLTSMPRRETVFGRGDGPFSGFSRCKRRLDDRCGVQDWTVHDLRRSWSTHAQDELEVEPHVVDEILGHVGGHRQGARRHYNHARYREPKRRALQRYADWLLGCEGTVVSLRA
jgi:integrase